MSIELEEMAWLGAAVLSAQKFEFGLYGVVAHLSEEVRASGGKKFEGLTGELFIRGDPNKLKATLGALVRFFGDELMLSSKEMEQYVSDRNFIVHNYWRASRANLQDDQIRFDHEFDNNIEYLKDFVERGDVYIGLIRGLIAVIIKNRMYLKNKDFRPTQKQIEDMELYYRNVAKIMDE